MQALGAVTSRLRFVTFVLKLPVRDPVLVAKQATSTAVLTGGRLVLGVGVSPWREDYEVLGVDWASRGPRMDESVAILRGLAAGGCFEHHGKVFDLPPVKIGAGAARPRFPCSSAVIRTPRSVAPPGWETAGCTAGETRRTCPACSPGSTGSAARKAPTAARSRCT